MKKQLKFDSVSELVEFVQCKISGDGYNDLLVKAGVIADWRS